MRATHYQTASAFTRRGGFSFMAVVEFRQMNYSSFRAKARSAGVEESPSCWPNGSPSGRLRFLDSLRSLGM